MQSAASLVLLVVLLNIAAMSLHGCGSKDSPIVRPQTSSPPDCPFVPPIENANCMNDTKKTIPHLGYALYKCEEGYSDNGMPSGEESIWLRCDSGYFKDFEKVGCAPYRKTKRCIFNDTLPASEYVIRCKGVFVDNRSEMGEGESCTVSCSKAYYEVQPNRYAGKDLNPADRAPTLLVCQEGVFHGRTPNCRQKAPEQECAAVRSKKGGSRAGTCSRDALVNEFDVYAAYTEVTDGDKHPSGQTFNKDRAPSNIEVFDLEGLLRYMYTSVFYDQQLLANIPDIYREDGEWAKDKEPFAPVYSGNVDTLVWYRMKVKNPSTIPTSKTVHQQFSPFANFFKGQSLTAVGQELRARDLAEQAKQRVTLTLKSKKGWLKLSQPEFKDIRGILTNLKDSKKKTDLMTLTLRPTEKQNLPIDATIADVKVFVCNVEGKWRDVNSLFHGTTDKSVLPLEIRPGQPRSPTYLRPDAEISEATRILVYSPRNKMEYSTPDAIRAKLQAATDAQVIFLDDAVTNNRACRFENDDWTEKQEVTDEILRLRLTDKLRPFYNVTLHEKLRNLRGVSDAIANGAQSFEDTLAEMLQDKLNNTNIEVVNIQKNEEAIKDVLVANADATTMSQVVGTFVGVKQDLTETIKICCKANTSHDSSVKDEWCKQENIELMTESPAGKKKSKWTKRKREFDKKCYKFDGRTGDPRYNSYERYNTFSLPGKCPNLLNKSISDSGQLHPQCVSKSHVFLFKMKVSTLKDMESAMKTIDPNLQPFESDQTSVSIYFPNDDRLLRPFKKLVEEVIYLHDKIQYPIVKSRADEKAKRMMNKEALDSLGSHPARKTRGGVATNTPIDGLLGGNYNISFVVGTSLLILQKENHSFVGGGLCPGETDLPDGSDGCTYTIKEVARIKLADVTGITSDSLCKDQNGDARNCKNIMDFKVNCRDTKHRVGVRLGKDEKQVTRNFMPGKTGIKYDEETWIVKAVNSLYQAHNKGVQEGEKIVKVFDPETENVWESLKEAEKGDKKYSVTFKVRANAECLEYAVQTKTWVDKEVIKNEKKGIFGGLKFWDRARTVIKSTIQVVDIETDPSWDCVGRPNDTEISLPFWKNRCSTDSNLERLQKIQNAFKEARDDLAPVMTVQDCESLEHCNAPRQDQGTGYCHRDSTGICSHCYIKGTVKFNRDAVANMKACRKDLFSSGGYASQPPKCSPSKVGHDDTSSCCEYLGTCGNLDWSYGDWSSCSTSGCGRGNQTRRAYCSNTTSGDCRRFIGDPACDKGIHECLVSCDSPDECFVQQDCRENKCPWAEFCNSDADTSPIELGAEEQHANEGTNANYQRLDTDQKYCLPMTWGPVESVCAWGEKRRYQRCSLYDPAEASAFCKDRDNPVELKERSIVKTPSRLHGCALCSLDGHSCQECIRTFKNKDDGCINSEPFFQLGLGVTVPSQSNKSFLSFSFYELQNITSDAINLANDSGLKWTFDEPILLDVYLHRTTQSHKTWNLSMAVPWQNEAGSFFGALFKRDAESTSVSRYIEAYDGAEKFAGAFTTKLRDAGIDVQSPAVNQIQLFCPDMREAFNASTPCEPESVVSAKLIILITICPLLVGACGGCGYFHYRRRRTPGLTEGVELVDPRLSTSSEGPEIAAKVKERSQIEPVEICEPDFVAKKSSHFFSRRSMSADFMLCTPSYTRTFLSSSFHEVDFDDHQVVGPST